MLKAKRHYPVCSVLLSLAAAAAFLLQDHFLVLQYDRAAIAAGQVWRLITCHWMHWSFEHFLWCAVVFIATGSICETLCPKGFRLTVLLAAAVIPLVLFCDAPDMRFYRGLSGICTALFCFAAIWLLRLHNDGWNRTMALVASVGLLLFFGKILFEYLCGRTLFVDGGNLFVPVPEVHLAGGIIGILMAFRFRKKERSSEQGRERCKVH